MATFTTELKNVIRYTDGAINYGNVTFNGVTYYLPVMTGGNIGLNNYPLFNNDYRNVLNGKIMDRYWNREIGAETIDDFQLMMRRKMNEIMPFYNKLYQTELINYEALSTVDLKTVAESHMVNAEDSEANATSDTLNNSNATGTNFAFPQNQLNSTTQDYATAATKSDSEATGEASSQQNSNSTVEADGNTESHTTGYQGVAADLIMRYRDSLLNIDLLILTDLEDCFMSVLNNGDAYTRNGWYYL